MPDARRAPCARQACLGEVPGIHGPGGTALIVRPLARLGRNGLDSGALIPRVQQYWDPGHVLAKQMAADARPPQPKRDCCQALRWGVIAACSFLSPARPE